MAVQHSCFGAYVTYCSCLHKQSGWNQAFVRHRFWCPFANSADALLSCINYCGSTGEEFDCCLQQVAQKEQERSCNDKMQWSDHDEQALRQLESEQESIFSDQHLRACLIYYRTPCKSGVCVHAIAPMQDCLLWCHHWMLHILTIQTQSNCTQTKALHCWHHVTTYFKLDDTPKHPTKHPAVEWCKA